MKKPISWNTAILIVVIIVVLLSLSKGFTNTGTMSIYDTDRKVSVEEFKTFILEGDNICSPGERRGSIDCKTEINFDSIIGCIWKEDVQCSSKFTTGIIVGIIVLLIYVMIGGQFGKKRKK